MDACRKEPCHEQRTRIEEKMKIDRNVKRTNYNRDGAKTKTERPRRAFWIHLPRVRARFDRQNRLCRPNDRRWLTEWHHERVERHWCHQRLRRSTVACRSSSERRRTSWLLPWLHRFCSQRRDRECVDESLAVPYTNDLGSCT